MPTNKPEYMHNYYVKHKRHILHGMTERIMCECCNRTYDKSKFNRHCRSMKHLKNSSMNCNNDPMNVS